MEGAKYVKTTLILTKAILHAYRTLVVVTKSWKSLGPVLSAMNIHIPTVRVKDASSILAYLL